MEISGIRFDLFRFRYQGRRGLVGKGQVRTWARSTSGHPAHPSIQKTAATRHFAPEHRTTQASVCCC